MNPQQTVRLAEQDVRGTVTAVLDDDASLSRFDSVPRRMFAGIDDSRCLVTSPPRELHDLASVHHSIIMCELVKIRLCQTLTWSTNK